MEKYYTPELEEFHNGFEYEAHEESVHSKKWFKKTYYGDSFLMNFKHDSIEFIQEFKKDLLRVKYLDSEDISSLGWKHGLMGIGDGHEIDASVFHAEHYEYIMTYADRHFIQIEQKTIGTDKKMYVFAGYIKNKSELKKLMQMIGII
jgi:hypothetical protein